MTRRFTRRLPLPILLLAFPMASPAAEPIWRWVEGEDAVAKSVANNARYDAVLENELSGGKWISHFSAGERGTASYKVELPEKRSYYLWVRANPVKSTLAARFNGGTWFRARLERRQRDLVNVADDSGYDLRFLAWSRVGVVPLKAGENTIDFRFQSAANNHGAIDCFCLTTDEAWLPSGFYKPGEKRPLLHTETRPLPEGQLKKWMDFIRPGEEELKWRDVRWHQALSDAAGEARALGRPILLWTMNGHPCGET